MPDAVPYWRTPVVGPGGFPLTPRPTRIADESTAWLDRLIRSDAQYHQVFLLANREKFRTVRLEYDRRPKADLDVFRNFWSSVKGMGGTFLFQHPETTESWRARFAKDAFVYAYDEDTALHTGAPAYSWIIELEEVP